MDKQEAAPNGTSIDSAIFAQLNLVPNQHAHRQTDTRTTLHTMSTATGRIFALHAGDAA